MPIITADEVIQRLARALFSRGTAYYSERRSWFTIWAIPLSQNCPNCGQPGSLHCVHARFTDPDFPDNHYLFVRLCARCAFSEQAESVEIDVDTEYSAYGPAEECPFCHTGAFLLYTYPGVIEIDPRT